jgi:hypothetical protein
MKRLPPKSLLARTALVTVALIASQLVSVLPFRYYRSSRFQLVAAGYISHLKPSAPRSTPFRRRSTASS